MDGTVLVEALVCGVNHPRQGMPVCSGCPRAVSNPQPTATDREPLTGFGGRGRERPLATDMETLTGFGRIRKRAHHRTAEINDDIRKAEEVFRHDLSFRRRLET